MKRFLLMLAVPVIAATSCGKASSWSSQERELICESDSVMRVLSVFDPVDSVVLRAHCDDIQKADIEGDTYKLLAEKLLATVQSPEQAGVGLAAPQVGISRRIVAVMRQDKEGEPFEVYPNIRITAYNGEPKGGSEGCLSVPGKRGDVMRWRDIEISYVSPETLQDTTERIKGFTAVIFQHECDHLDGVLYTDKAENVRDR